MEDNSNLSASQLAAFVAAVAPYAIAKKSDDGKKEDSKEPTISDQFSMFKLQVNNIKKADPSQSN